MRKTVVHFLFFCIFSSTLLFCKSNAQRQNEKDLSFIEVPPLSSPYLKDAHISAYIKDKPLMKKFAASYGINSDLLISKIDAIRMSMSDTQQLLIVEMKNLDVGQKIRLMNMIKASPTPIHYLYETVDPEHRTIYLNLKYSESIVVSNFLSDEIESEIGWEVPNILVTSEAQNISAWLWFRDNILKQLLTQIDIDGVAVVIKTYIPHEEAELKYIVKTPNDKSVRTTIKLLLPLFVKSFENEGRVGIPQPYFEDDYLIIDNVFVSDATITSLIQ